MAKRIISKLSILVVFLFPSPVMAQVGIVNFSAYNSIEEVVLAILSLLQPIVILAFIAMVIYAGWLYLTSQGDADKIKQAKQIITAAIVGFVIIVLAPSLVRLVASILGVNPDLLKV